jgi:hypothetical protein
MRGYGTGFFMNGSRQGITPGLYLLYIVTETQVWFSMQSETMWGWSTRYVVGLGAHELQLVPLDQPFMRRIPLRELLLVA